MEAIRRKTPVNTVGGPDVTADQTNNPALEEVTILLLVTKAWRLLRSYQAAFRQQPHFWPSMQLAVQQSLGPAGVLLIGEVEMMRYALLGWWAKPEATPETTTFSIYQESGFTAFAVMLGVALAVETADLHLLVSLWSARVAG